MLVVVSGPPASGKTSLARALARELDLPWIGKDALKETLSRNSAPTKSSSRSSTGRRRGSCLRSPSSSSPPASLIHCAAEEEELLERFAERAGSPDRHPGHADRPEKVDEVRDDLERGRWEALDLPGELVEIDLAEQPDVAALGARIRAAE